MANKILQNPTFESNKGYTGFPMQHSVKFSNPVGYLLPVMSDFLIPGDKVRVKSFIRTRTEPLNTAAMAHIQETIRYFFVPIEQLDHSFGSFFYGIQDYGSSFFFQPDPGSSSGLETISHDQFLPFVNLRDIAKFLVYHMIDNDVPNPGGVNPQGEREYTEFQKLVRFLDGLGVPVLRILELMELQYPQIPQSWDDANYSKVPTLPFSLYFPAAYQKIYSDYFRLSDREMNDARSYNLDRYAEASPTIDNETVLQNLLRGLFKLRRVAYNRDYFMAGVPSPVMGTEGVSALNGSEIIRVEQWLSGLSRISPGVPNGDVSDGLLTEDFTFPTSVGLGFEQGMDVFSSLGHINPANIRQLFATEKLLEVTRRAGKHYDKQTLAHYGIDVPMGQSGECFEIGRDDSDIIIGDVVSTSATEQAVLGEIGGKGYNMSSGRQHEFTAKTHGVLMAVYYATPIVDYEQVGLQKYLQVSEPIDIPIPEYDNLGQQPLFYHESLLQAADSTIDNNAISNWQYRWSEWKQRYNRVFGGFQTDTFKDWTFMRRENVSSLLNSYLVDPEITNSIFVYQFSETPLVGSDIQVYTDAYKLVYEADPLFHELVFDYSKASKMSRYGLPSL